MRRRQKLNKNKSHGAKGADHQSRRQARCGSVGRTGRKCTTAQRPNWASCMGEKGGRRSPPKTPEPMRSYIHLNPEPELK